MPQSSCPSIGGGLRADRISAAKLIDVDGPADIVASAGPLSACAEDLLVLEESRLIPAKQIRQVSEDTVGKILTI